ncbi:MAG: c-type cytochrome [Ideonella sp.]|jgi:cytochrome c553|nr:c-type cytochrome [Ideonella sp.]
MKTFVSSTLAVALLVAPILAWAQTSRPEADYKWARMDGEFAAALAAQGSAPVGKVGYESCVGCHLASGAGRSDGSIPQLAGQHATVLIKQMADIRKGVRDNPSMLPYARQLTDAQGLADVAAYIESLCVPPNHGRYEGADLAQQVAAGKTLYQGQCKGCHGANGAGHAAKFYPVIAGQHYKYLLRQMTEIRDGKRRNANPEMVEVIKPYTNEQLVAISAYQASLAMPGASCRLRNAGPATK